MFDKIPKNVQRLSKVFKLLLRLLRSKIEEEIQKCNGRMIVTNQFNEVIQYQTLYIDVSCFMKIILVCS